MGQPARTSSLSPEDYLRIERDAPTRSEYLRGEMFDMAGGSQRHSLIKTNLASELHRLTKGRPCAAYDSDLRVLVLATGLYTYPDASVVWGELEYDPHDDSRSTVTNPVLIAEVLSKSTQSYDRGKKFHHYRQIDSLREYLLISQDNARVERFTRNTDKTWTLLVRSGLEETMELTSIYGHLSLAELFEKVEFGADDEGDPLPDH